MKQIYIEKQAKDQVHQNFRNTNSEVHSLLIRVRPNSDFLNIFLIQNKGKGPPGDILHPDHPPDGEAVLKASTQVIQCHPELVSGSFQDPNFIDVRPRNKFGVTNSDFNQILNTEIQLVNKNQYSKFLQTLNFTNMKKQILFLAMFVLAVFTGMNKSYGQTYIDYLEAAAVTDVKCAPVVTLNCVNDDGELTPIPGKTYKYGVTVTPGTFQSIHWFVTDEADVITAAALTAAANRDVIDGTYILDATAASYDIPGNTTATIDISWKYFNGASNNVLLVAYVTGDNGCSDNIEVYRIQPSIGFTLDVGGLLADGSLGDEECLSSVESANYNGTNLTMDYGENWVFFTVTAANFVHSWMPDLSAAPAEGSTIGTIEWAYPADALSGTATGWHATTVAVDAQDASGAVGTGGECIVVRVQVDHAGVEHREGDPVETITLSVDGIMYDAQATNYTNPDLADLDNGAAATDPCVNDHTDTFDYKLTPRPAIDSDTTVGTGDKAFEPKN